MCWASKEAKRPRHMCKSVIALEDFFLAVGEGAIAEQETEAAIGEVDAMIAYDSIDYEDCAGAVVLRDATIAAK